MNAVDPVIAMACRNLFDLYGRPVTVLPRSGGAVEALAVEEHDWDRFGEAGRAGDARLVLAFLVDTVRPEPGDDILLDGRTLTVDAVADDDGIVRTVWVK